MSDMTRYIKFSTKNGTQVAEFMAQTLVDDLCADGVPPSLAVETAKDIINEIKKGLRKQGISVERLPAPGDR